VRPGSLQKVNAYLVYFLSGLRATALRRLTPALVEVQEIVPAAETAAPTEVLPPPPPEVKQ
jgi:hypothetical protein